MKKWFLLLLVLAMAVPAMAQAPADKSVLVYKMSDKSVSYMEDVPEWEMEKENVKGYLVLEGGPGDDTVDLWVIYLWKAKDPNTGKMQKYVASEEIGEFDIIEAEISKKTYWIIVGGDQEQQVFLKGRMTEAKLGDKEQHFAKKLTGIVIWDEDNSGERNIGSKKISLTLQKKKSAELQGLDAESAAEAIVDYLVDEKGYIEED